MKADISKKMGRRLPIGAIGFASVQLYTGNSPAGFPALPPYLNNSHFVAERSVLCKVGSMDGQAGDCCATLAMTALPRGIAALRS
jgi:hypothetical protein